MLGPAMLTTVAAVAALPALVASMRPLFPPDREDHSLVAAPSRRIQYLSTHKAGLSDRLSIFTFLNTLAHFHNATAHIQGGLHGAKLLLEPKHSVNIAEDWDFYLDTTGNGGNPFHEVDTKMSCREIVHPGTDWSRIFDDGGHCVNIQASYYSFNCSERERFRNKLYMPGPSENVKSIAQQALKTVSRNFGLLHIRRCDRLTVNLHCTDPDHVKELVAGSRVRSWLVFTYAEIGYLPALQKRLATVARHHFAYEDDLFSAIKLSNDNYLKYAVVIALQKMARAEIDLHQCDKQHLATRVPENWPDVDSLEIGLLTGTCGGEGSHKLYKEPKEGNSTQRETHFSRSE